MADASLAEAHTGLEPEKAVPSSFDDFPISSELREAIADMGFTEPTEVQSAVVGTGLAGRDCVVQAKTGSGKTCAFGIPLVERLRSGGGEQRAPQALVLTPTRELASQVAAELQLLGAKKGTKILAVYGGVSMGSQISGLKEGVDIVVGTPGRLLDHIRRKNMTLGQAKAVVLDEADEMLSMGFWDDVTDLLKMSPEGRQTMLFSATLPYQVARAAATFLKDPERIDVSGDELTVDGIDNHIVHVVPDIPKPRQLLYVLETEQPDSAIIFCNTRNETEMIAKYLTQAGLVAEPISGNLKQKDRERVMSRIKSGELRYMVATDIAARGIDVEDLSHVVNYALPEFSEVYLHRVGRTGRAGKTGAAVSLVDGRGLGTLSVLEREFQIGFTEVVLPEQDEILRRRSERIMKELSEKASVAEVGQHLPVAKNILDSEDGPQVIAFLLKSYFNSHAERRTPRTESAPAPERERERERERPAPRREESASAAADTEGGDGSRRRRRRRRRRRSDGPGGGVGGGVDAVDAAEMLASGSGNGASTAPASDGLRRVRVNIGFDDGFKGRGAVAKKISALAGLTEGTLTEIEARRDHAVLKASPEIAELVVERVDGAQIGKKVVSVSVAS